MERYKHGETKNYVGHCSTCEHDGLVDEAVRLLHGYYYEPCWSYSDCRYAGRGEVLLDVRHKYRFGEAVRLTRELAVKLDEALRQEAEKQ